MAETTSLFSRKALIVIAMIVIIIVGGVGAWWYLINLPPPTNGGNGGTAVTLRVITRHDSTIQLKMEQAFLQSPQAQAHNITDIAWTQPAASFWPAVIPTTQPDIAWGGGPSLFDTLDDLDLLVKLDSDNMTTTLARVPDTLAGTTMKRYDTDNDVVWVAAAISSFGFTINEVWLTDKGLPEPTHWENLSSPQFGSLLPIPSVCMGNAPGTTSNTRIYEIIVQKFGWSKGWEILSRMAGNSEIRAGSVEVQSAVEAGEVGVSMSIDFYGYTSALRNPNTRYIIPTNGSIINGDPIAICSTVRNQPAAEAFIDWVISCEGQKWWLLEEINRMPVLECAFWADQADPVNPGGPRDDLYLFYNSTIQNLSIDFSDDLVNQYEYSLIYYFESVITNAHTALVSCWNKLIDALDGALINQAQFDSFAAQMANVTWGSDEWFSEAYAISINNQMQTSSSFRALTQSTWRSAAEAHYATVEALIPP